MFKQGMLVGALVMSFGVLAQEQSNQEQQEVAAVSAATIQTQAVTASAASNPSPVPQVASSLRAAQSDIRQAETTLVNKSVDGEETPAASEASNNSNASGIQIFNLNTNDNKAKQEAINEANATRADELRRERIRRELLNEGRVVEKLEEDRIKNENSRSGKIEGMEFSNASQDLQSVNVAAVGSQVQVTQSQASSTGGSLEATLGESSHSGWFGTQAIKLIPLVGYRFTPTNNDSYYRSVNKIVAGAALEGQVASALALEVNYLFGHDELQERSYGNGFYGQPNYNNYSFLGNIRTRNTHEFNANAKLGWFKGQVSPFILGGLGAMYTDYNIDDTVTEMQTESIGFPRSSIHMTSNVGGGVDFKVGSNISLGARVEYQFILTSRNNTTQIDAIYGDSSDRVKAIAGLQIIF